MREFHVIKSDGTGMIIDAENESEVISQVGHDIKSIEESQESKRRHNIEENTQVSFSTTCINDGSSYSLLEVKVDKLIRVINGMKNISVWEKKFTYGLKRQIKNNNIPSKIQLERFNNLYQKVIK